MSGNTNNQIESLLSKKSAAASVVTSSLKSIGNGDMLNGVKNIHRSSALKLKRAEKVSFVKGGVSSAALVLAVQLIPKGVKFAKRKWNERKQRKAMKEQSHVAYSKEVSDIPSEKEDTTAL